MATTQRVAWLSVLVVNLILVAIKATLAVITGSLAITADAIHFLTDQQFPARSETA